MTPRGQEGAGYFLIHLVSREAMTPLVASQVVDHAEVQATAPGANAPDAVAVGLLEPARVAVKRALRVRAREFSRRAPHVRIAILPFSSRFRRLSVALLAARLRRLAGRRPIAMHCRGEDAVVWAADLARQLRRRDNVAIITDIRGAWPEEFLLARGFDTLEAADAPAKAEYDRHVTRLREALASSSRVLTVSKPLKAWLVNHGALPSRIAVVPCCVSRVLFSSEARSTARAELGVADDTIVLAYVGSVTPYQHVEDGALAFVRDAVMHDPRVFLLAITQDDELFTRLAVKTGIPADRYVVKRVSQDRVPFYLSAADAGLLLRASSTVNAVSMPVKLGEYLSCGLPVIVSRIPGWVDDVIDEGGAGVAVRWFGASEGERASAVAHAVEALRAKGGAYRDRALRLCRERFVWGSYVETVRRSYVEGLADASEPSPVGLGPGLLRSAHVPGSKDRTVPAAHHVGE